MPVGNPNWVPGHKTTNGHRPLGSRNRRTKELEDLLTKRGDRDPLEFQSQIVSDNTIELEIRLAASIALAPYRHGKMGAVPPLRYIEEPIVLPHPNPTMVDEVNANIAHINQAFAAGNLDIEFFNALLAGQREHIVSFKALGDPDLAHDQVIRIEGGLPSLPGTNITMPELNGHEINGVLAPPSSALEPAIDPPVEPP
jgi:hypothetical protein